MVILFSTVPTSSLVCPLILPSVILRTGCALRQCIVPEFIPTHFRVLNSNIRIRRRTQEWPFIYSSYVRVQTLNICKILLTKPQVLRNTRIGKLYLWVQKSNTNFKIQTFAQKKCMYLHISTKIKVFLLVVYTKNKPCADYVQKLKTKISTKNCEN